MNTRPVGIVLWCLATASLLSVGVAAQQPPAPASPGPTEPALGRRFLTLAQASWIYRPPEEPRELKLYDIVVVLVDEKAEVISEGEMDRRKKADGTFVLKDWISLAGLNLKPAAQEEGEPAITGQMQGKFRSEAELETRDSIKFQIACRVVDIRPNETLVLEGHRSIRNNTDVWETWLFGVIRAEDVLPNNTVLSKNIDGLRIIKRESGHVRDGYRRGWFTRWLDRFQPF